MKTLKLIVILQSIIIVILILLLFKNKLFGSEESNLQVEYDKIKNKSVLEMTEAEWNMRNEYIIWQAKKNGTQPDTISYLTAKSLEHVKNAINEANNPCNNDNLITAFHDIMKFNMPYDQYERESITVQNSGNCSIYINVTTTDPKHGWKTFWIFEVFYNDILEKYEVKTIKRDFRG